MVQLLDFHPNANRSMERFLLALAGRLREQGWLTVHVFCGEPAEDFRARLTELDSPYLVTQFPLTRARGAELGARLRGYAPSVIQTHFVSMFSPGFRPLLRASGACRLVVTDHLSGHPRRKSAFGRALSRVRGWWAGRLIDQIIAVSEFVRRRDISEVHLPARRIRVVHNGIDTEGFAPSPAGGAGGFTVAFAGRLIPEKGCLTLLRAVARLAGRRPDLNVQIAGVGPQAGELRQFCQASGLSNRVRFLGQVDRVDRLFQSADVVVVPSEMDESFGLVAAEAAACGACVVVSDAGALPEVIGPDGRAGFVFRRGDAEDLAVQLERLMADPDLRARTGRAARDRVTAHFSLRNMVDGHCRYFTEFRGRP